MTDVSRPEHRSLGRRIVREATPAEHKSHEAIRAAIDAERPEIVAWARDAAGQMAVGTVFTADEIPVLEAIDAYAATHNLSSRSAVVREALSRLLDMQVDVEPKRSA